MLGMNAIGESPLSSLPEENDSWEKVGKKPLGKGGQGRIWKVKHKRTGQLGVLKVLNKNSPKAKNRMQQEVVSLKIVHEGKANIPKVLEEQTNGNSSPYFIMEFIDGNNLNNIMDNKKSTSADTALSIAISLCNTLKIAHNLGIFHRDIKPENIIIRSLDPINVVIVDFGLSFRTAKENVRNITEHGESVGNKFLILPERHGNHAEQRDKRSDITYVCGVLFYCITGQYPGLLCDPTSGKMPHQRVSMPIKDLKCARIWEILNIGFQFSLRDRFSDVDELLPRLVSIRTGSDQGPSLEEIADQTIKHFRDNDPATQKSNCRADAQKTLSDLTHYSNGSPVNGFWIQPSDRLQEHNWKGQSPIAFWGRIFRSCIPEHKSHRFIAYGIYFMNEYSQPVRFRFMWSAVDRRMYKWGEPIELERHSFNSPYEPQLFISDFRNELARACKSIRKDVDDKIDFDDLLSKGQATIDKRYQNDF